MLMRFSVKAFIIATVVHLSGTIALIDASFRTYRPFSESEEPVWLSLWAWIWQPISMLVSYYLRHHPRAPVITTNLEVARLSGWGLSESFFYCMLPWSVFVAIFFGFLVPWVLRRQSKSNLTNRCS